MSKKESLEQGPTSLHVRGVLVRLGDFIEVWWQAPGDTKNHVFGDVVELASDEGEKAIKIKDMDGRNRVLLGRFISHIQKVKKTLQ